MADFEKELLQATERVVLKKISEGGWLGIPFHSFNPYSEGSSRLEIKREFLLELYNKIDLKRISDLVLAKVEERIADKIFNQLATELGNDTKSLMCDAKARESFREVIRERIQSVCHESEVSK